ncbi:MAG: exodeoxyribonuclease VII small subunit [Candidatus Omnitrophica bacterium]|nr:exodeoxyribonuclease VII small subunit [Candidatus Omnitrophota bacterium]
MPEEMKFEKALERLEEIVSQLESGDIALEEAIKRYEEGVKLSRVCLEKLSQAERKVEILTKALSGEIKKEPFDLDEDEETGALKKTRKKNSSPAKEAAGTEPEGTLFS